MAKQKLELISQADAARLLGITRSAVSYLVDGGRLKAEEVAGRRLVKRSDVLAYKQERERGGKDKK
jgi:excisionase family DNA binding protein